VPVTDDIYNNNFYEWIYTSSFIPYTDNMVRLYVFNIPEVYRYLSNFSCPDGYEGNTITLKCDLYPLGTESFENVC